LFALGQLNLLSFNADFQHFQGCSVTNLFTLNPHITVVFLNRAVSHPDGDRYNFEKKAVFKKFHFALLLFKLFGRITGFEKMFTIVTSSHETFDVNTVLRPSHADFYQGSLK
jgi:hypothetical protein